MNGIVTKFTENFEQQAVEYTDLLFYLARKGESTAEDRCARVKALTEAYFAYTDGYWPDGHVLERLASLILHDELTDPHPDKMTRADYPIMSDNQQRSRRKRDLPLSNVYTGQHDVTIGRYKDHDGVKRRIYDYMTPARDMAPVTAVDLDLHNALDRANLTDRQREVVELLYDDGMTQTQAAERLGVSQASVSMTASSALDKIRKYL